MSSSVVGGPLLAGDRVGVLAAAVDGLAGLPAGVLTEAELVGELAGIRAQIGRLEALCAERLAAADRRGVAAAAGAVSTQAWYRRVGQLPAGQAGAAVRRARALAADLPGLRAAGIEGRVCWAKLRVAAGQATAAPAHLLGVVEPALLAAAGELDVGQFERVCRAARERAEALLGTDPDARAYQQRYLRVSPVGERVRIDGQLDRADGEVLRTALDAPMNPASTPTRPRAGGTDRPGGAGEPDGAGGDRRPARVRRADALVWLAQHALNTGAGPSSAGTRPHLDILVDLATLRAETARLLRPQPPTGPSGSGGPSGPSECSGAGGWERRVAEVADLLPALTEALTAREAGRAGGSGGAGGAWAGHRLGPLPPAELLRFACDATLRRIVVDGTGEPLDVGRPTRTFPPALRKALEIRDRGCVHPGCDRPPGWCEAHHLIHHLHGGPTQISNGALVCGHHHTRLHKTGTTLTRGPDRRWQLISYTQALEHWKHTGALPGAPPVP